MSKNQRSCGKSCNCIMNPKVLTGCVPDKWWHCFGETSELDHDLSPIIYRWFSHRVQNSFWFFFASGFGFLFLLSFPVPFALYLQQLGTRTCHFAWYLLHFGMVTLHFAWYLLHLAIFAFHFAWYLSYFGISTSHLHGICYILVLQTFMWVSWGFFRLSFRVSFKVSLRVSFRVLFRASFGVSFRVSFRVSLGFHLGFL